MHTEQARSRGVAVTGLLEGMDDELALRSLERFVIVERRCRGRGFVAKSRREIARVIRNRGCRAPMPAPGRFPARARCRPVVFREPLQGIRRSPCMRRPHRGACCARNTPRGAEISLRVREASAERASRRSGDREVLPKLPAFTALRDPGWSRDQPKIARTGRVPPTRSNSRSCSARSSLACRPSGSSPISSRNASRRRQLRFPSSGRSRP